MGDKPFRILVGKPGMDTHWRGAEAIAQALRDGGMEVIYTGPYQSHDMIVNAAMAEDVDVIALSVMGGSQIPHCRGITQLLKSKGMNIPVVVGGIIPEEDTPILGEMGVTGFYGPGTDMDIVIDHIKKRAAENRA